MSVVVYVDIAKQNNKNILKTIELDSIIINYLLQQTKKNKEKNNNN